MSQHPQQGTVKRLAAPVLSGLAALMLCLVGLSDRAQATEVTLCPSAGSVDGNNQTSGLLAGPLDGTCGINSAVHIAIPASTDYGRLAFVAGTTPGYPAGLTFGGLLGLSAQVNFTGANDPFYMLAFTDSGKHLGQSNGSDQILMIEFQTTTLTGTTMAVDPNSTLFNLFDNTTGHYLGTGQQDKNTVAGWLAADPVLAGESVQQIRIGIGLTGGDSGPEALTINSLDVSSAVPEPAALTLLGVALAGIGISRRRRGGRPQRRLAGV